MTLSMREKAIIKQVIDESLTTLDQLLQKSNQFFADTNDVSGIIGWKILNQIAENNQLCRTYIETVPNEFETHNEIGEYVKEIIERNIGVR